jgi:hypothetical protein
MVAQVVALLIGLTQAVALELLVLVHLVKVLLAAIQEAVARAK